LEVQKQLRKKGIRVEIDDRSEKIGKKIRDTEVAHIPYMFVIGEKEMLANSAALRIQGKGDQGVFSISDLVERIKSEIEERA